MTLGVVRQFVGHDGLQFLVVPGKPVHSDRDEDAVAIRVGVDAVVVHQSDRIRTHLDGFNDCRRIDPATFV